MGGCDVGAAVRRALEEHGGVPEEVISYAGDTAAGLADDMADEGADAIAAEMEDALLGLLDGTIADADVTALCNQVVKAFKGIVDGDVSDAAAAGGGGAVEAEEAGGAAQPGRDMLVKCDSIILAYAGKSLLRTTKLHLARGARYGIVGQKRGQRPFFCGAPAPPAGSRTPGLVTSRSQVGKTTLLNHIAGGLIADFPQDIKVVHVQHEILANDEQSVLDYMQAARASHGAAPGAASVSQVLDEMGFTPELQRSAVLELSGGLAHAPRARRGDPLPRRPPSARRADQPPRRAHPT